MIKNLGVFCGSSAGNLPLYKEGAEKLADAMSEAGITLVYGGSKVGLMNHIADRMLKNGSSVIGVIPKSLVEVEIAHEKLTELHIVNSMHERKALMANFSDAFIMLPGGFGSLDEFFEVLTWSQLGLHVKPCGILNTAGVLRSSFEILRPGSLARFSKRGSPQYCYGKPRSMPLD